MAETHRLQTRDDGAVTGWTEDARLAALHRLRILDTPPEPAFDRVVALARRIFDAPIVAVSLIDRDRQWFKARCGIDATETPRSVSFCSHTIQVPGEILCVPDASQDPRFADNPMVAGPPHVRFYAGAPVLAPGGEPIGAVCVVDTVPRPPLSRDQAEALADLAGLATDELALREAAARMAREVGEKSRLNEALGLANRNLSRVNARHQRNLQSAALAQRRSLPNPRMSLPGLEIASLHLASQDLSGDVFGYGPLPDDSAYVWMADVTGHGVAAALQAVTVGQVVGQQLLREGAGELPHDPAELLRRLNARLYRGGDDELTYFTMLSARYLPDEEMLTLAAGGHPPPLVIRRGRGGVEPADVGGLPLGMFPDADFDGLELAFGSGARVVVYSDGLVDSHNDDGAEFGLDRLLDWAVSTAELDAVDAVAELRHTVYAWTGRRPPDDDVAVIVIDRTDA